jgi:hypothetical protein
MKVAFTVGRELNINSIEILKAVQDIYIYCIINVIS